MLTILEGIRLVIFDADDTLRHTTVEGKPCPHASGEWQLMPNVRETLSAIEWRRRGIQLGVASNQDQVGYGLLTMAMAERLLRDAAWAATSGAYRDPLIRLCPHRLEIPCTCRKPEPGLLLDVMRAAGRLPHETRFVGDAQSDREAAQRAHVHFTWAHEFFDW
jgi:D-glycero-D-manno-heptose 1,7-bisphosphate phosphatase